MWEVGSIGIVIEGGGWAGFGTEYEECVLFKTSLIPGLYIQHMVKRLLMIIGCTPDDIPRFTLADWL